MTKTPWLAEGAFAKAEKIARLAVTMLEGGDEPLLLSEALITHSIALSHLNRKEEAKAGFERAIGVAEQTGELERAGLAIITFLEHIGPQLPDDEVCDILQRARELLKENPNPTVRDRLLDCAFYVLSLVHTFHFDWTNYSFDKKVLRYEERQIRRALEDTGGVIAKAARSLDLSNQNLHEILNNRHKNLRNEIPAIKARRSKVNLNQKTGRDLSGSVAKNSGTVRILHVEDDRTVADMTQEMLEEEGWKVDSCTDGNKALEKIVGNAHYDLLLLDDKLPGVNGIELAHRARQLAHRSRTPIIVVSATPGDAAARKAGADVFLPKPQVVSSLVETITRLLAKREQEG